MREQIGPYRIERVLGEGGMGLVYKGRHQTLDRDVAIKTLRAAAIGDADLLRRLAAEARAQERLNHPAIVRVYDLIPDEKTGELFIVMELVDGETLASRLARCANRRMTLAEALPLFEKVLVALDYVHGEQVVHRDVKPSNVMLCGGQVKLMDFGLALHVGATRLTEPLHIHGTRAYMSPEQLEGEDLDRRTDIYSAALVLYAMLAGRDAFDSSSDVLQQLTARRIGPRDLRSILPDLPSGVCEAVAIALQFDRTRRFPSAGKFRDALREGEVGYVGIAPPHANATTAPGVDPTAPTEPIPSVAAASSASAPPDPPPLVTAPYMWLAIVGSVAAVGYVGVRHLQAPPRFSSQPPNQGNVVPRVIAVEIPPPTIPPATPSTKRPSEPKQPPNLGIDVRAEEERAKQAAVAREIEQLRDQIAALLTGAEADIVAERFGGAGEQLDEASEQAQRYPSDFASERQAIAGLRAGLVNAEVAVRARRDQEALWESQLAKVQSFLTAGQWPEAKNFARLIADDPKAPPAVADRARELLQQAQNGLVDALRTSTFGETTNTIRKPSPPPRKNH